MKISKRFAAAIFCIILVIIAILALASGQKPFKHLEASDIAAAEVRLTPPDKTVRIADMKELAGYLNEAVVYHKDNSYTEYCGQGVVFTLTMADGSQREIMAYNPFLVIDGVGYRTKYAPCNALNSYANGLLDAEDAAILMREPPRLDVVVDETCTGAQLNGYSWDYLDSDGYGKGGIADSPHPMGIIDRLPLIETAAQTAELRFAEEPDNIRAVHCWSDENLSDYDVNGEDAPIDGDRLTLKPGGYVYEICAEWEKSENGGGFAYYSFYVKVLG